jgi:hypothetical protein
LPIPFDPDKLFFNNLLIIFIIIKEKFTKFPGVEGHNRGGRMKSFNVEKLKKAVAVLIDETKTGETGDIADTLMASHFRNAYKIVLAKINDIEKEDA